MIIIFTDSFIVSGTVFIVSGTVFIVYRTVMMISLKMAAKFAISPDTGRKVTQ